MYDYSYLKYKLTEEDFKGLIDLALRKKEKVFGESCYLRGIVEFSNYCVRNCFFCGIRCGNREVNRYRISFDRMYEIVRDAYSAGIKTIVFQSGEDANTDIYSFGKFIERIKSDFKLAVTLSLGDLKRDDYRYLKECGGDRYLLKFETSDEVIFEKFKPGTTLKERIKKIFYLKELGFETGSGNIIGLPGTNLGTLIGDLKLIYELDLDMIGVGPFIPHNKTPLSNCQGPSTELSLRFLALVRIMNPMSHIPATTSFDALEPSGRKKALRSGANVIMMDVTPPEYSKNYDIYRCKRDISFFSDLRKKIKEIESLVEESGARLVKDIGSSFKK